MINKMLSHIVRVGRWGYLQAWVFDGALAKLWINGTRRKKDIEKKKEINVFESSHPMQILKL